MFLTSQSRAEVIREFSPWYIRSRRIEICQRLISIHLDLSVWTSQMAQVRNRQEQWRQMSFVSIVTHQDYRLVLFTVILWNNSSFFLPFLSLYTLQCAQLIRENRPFVLLPLCNLSFLIDDEKDCSSRCHHYRERVVN